MWAVCPAQTSPAHVPLHPWEWPRRPWTRLHVDYAGPFMGNMFLVLIDAHSKWKDVHTVSSATSYSTISVLRTIFASHGLPEILVPDNRTAFTSSEFGIFLRQNGIRYITSAHYHPATNGLAERAVQIIKNSLKKSEPGDIDKQLARLLFHYRTTPHATTGISPAELLMGRPLRTHLDLLRPNIATRVHMSQASQKLNYDRKSRSRSFSVEDSVFARQSNNDSPWLPGTVAAKLGELTYQIQLDDGRMLRRHIDQIHPRHLEIPSPEEMVIPNEAPFLLDNTTGQPTTVNSEPEPVLRRSSRVRHPLDRYTA